jgi:hypothetical protein
MTGNEFHKLFSLLFHLILGLFFNFVNVVKVNFKAIPLDICQDFAKGSPVFLVNFPGRFKARILIRLLLF